MRNSIITQRISEKNVWIQCSKPWLFTTNNEADKNVHFAKMTETVIFCNTLYI